MSARMNIFKTGTLSLLKAGTSSGNKTSSELLSVCMPATHRSTWTQQNVEYTVLGPDTKEQHSYDKCLANVVKTIQSKFNAPGELKSKDIFAFSYYFDRLNSAKTFSSLFCYSFFSIASHKFYLYELFC
jgi:hypothetical protein